MPSKWGRCATPTPTRAPVRRRILSLALALAIGMLLAPASATGHAHDAGRHAERAVLARDAMQEHFSVGLGVVIDRGLYRETAPSAGGLNNRYAYVWPFSQAWTALADVASLPGADATDRRDLRRSTGALERYWDATSNPAAYDSAVRPPLGLGGDVFYDDNEWIALELIRQHATSGDPMVLARVEALFDLIVAGWSTDASLPCPGGVAWTQAAGNTDRNTVSTAPAAQIALHLHRLTGEDGYLDWARRMIGWVDGCMRAPNGLYWDHIDARGAIERTQWSYNQGTVIGAKVLLHQATGDEAALRDAQAIAEAALSHYGSDDRYRAQDTIFNAIFFRNLRLLDEVAPDPRLRQAAEAYADTVWEEVRDPGTGLFAPEPGQPAHLLDQAAMVQLLATLATWEDRG